MNPTQIKSAMLNKRVTFQAATATKDKRGNVQYTYPSAKEIWAEIEPYSSRIISGEAMKFDEVLYRITIRYRALALHDRIKYQGRIFEQTIPAVDVNERHVWLQLTCKEVV